MKGYGCFYIGKHLNQNERCMRRTSGEKTDTGETEFLRRWRRKTRRKAGDRFPFRNRCQGNKLMALVDLCRLFEPGGKIICWEWSKMRDLGEQVDF